MPLVSNAPQDWPRPQGEALSDLLRALNDPRLGRRVERLRPALPSKEGVLFADALVKDPAGRYAVFLFSQADEVAARRFYAAVSYLLAYFPALEPVYYARAPLDPVVHAVEDLDLERGFVLRPVARPRPGRYPIWRTDDATRRFPWTALWARINEHMRFLAGREWVGLGLVLEALGLAADWREAEEVRDRLLLIPLEAPDGGALLVSYRPDRGLRLHLHEAHPEEDFLPWWDWFSGYLKRHWPDDAPLAAASSPPLEWWGSLAKRLEATPAVMVASVRREDV